MARTVRTDGLITKKGADSRVRRAVKRALAEERRKRPHAFTDDEILAHNESFRRDVSHEVQAALYKSHVVLTQEGFDREIVRAGSETRKELERIFPYMYSESELRAHNKEVCEAHEKELRAAFDVELLQECAEAKAAGAKEVVEAIQRLVSGALPEGIFSEKPHFTPGIAWLSCVLLEHTRRKLGATEAEFAIDFATSVFSAM